MWSNAYKKCAHRNIFSFYQVPLMLNPKNLQWPHFLSYITPALSTFPPPLLQIMCKNNTEEKKILSQPLLIETPALFYTITWASDCMSYKPLPPNSSIPSLSVWFLIMYRLSFNLHLNPVATEPPLPPQLPSRCPYDAGQIQRQKKCLQTPVWATCIVYVLSM